MEGGGNYKNCYNNGVCLKMGVEYGQGKDDCVYINRDGSVC